MLLYVYLYTTTLFQFHTNTYMHTHNTYTHGNIRWKAFLWEIVRKRDLFIHKITCGRSSLEYTLSNENQDPNITIINMCRCIIYLGQKKQKMSWLFNLSFLVYFDQNDYAFIYVEWSWYLGFWFTRKEGIIQRLNWPYTTRNHVSSYRKAFLPYIYIYEPLLENKYVRLIFIMFPR